MDDTRFGRGDPVGVREGAVGSGMRVVEVWLGGMGLEGEGAR